MENIDLIAQDGLFVVTRNAKPLMTPARFSYALPTQKAGEAVLAEWRAADEKKIDPRTMPMTQFAATSIDLMSAQKEKVVQEIAAYGESELLCYRAEGPSELVALQAKVWQPYLDWAENELGARLAAAASVMPLRQPREAIEALTQHVKSFDLFRLTGVRHAVNVSGSLVLGLALAKGQKNADDIFYAAELESTYQCQHWGEDAETTARRDKMLQDLKDVERWLRVLG